MELYCSEEYNIYGLVLVLLWDFMNLRKTQWLLNVSDSNVFSAESCVELTLTIAFFTTQVLQFRNMKSEQTWNYFLPDRLCFLLLHHNIM